MIIGTKLVYPLKPTYTYINRLLTSRRRLKTMTTPNELVNSVCLKYHTGEILPGYDSDTRNCIYYKKELDSSIPIMCAIGASVSESTARMLEKVDTDFTGLVESDNQGVVEDLVDKLDDCDLIYTLDVTKPSLSPKGKKFFKELQYWHDSYFMVREEYRRYSLSEVIWINMHRKFPELIIEHFLPTETNDSLSTT